MNLRDHGIWWAGLCLAPVLAAQAVRVRRRTPLLPAAAPPLEATEHPDRATAAARLEIVVLGESTAAGVGARTQRSALAGRLAHALAGRLGRPVRYRAIGLIGATARALDALVASDRELRDLRADLVVVALGVNDTTKLTRRRSFRRALESVLQRLRRDAAVPVLFAGVPPVDRFPALPAPLEWVLGARARMLDRELAAVADRHPGCRHHRIAPLDDRALLAEDGFHPSEAGYALWAEHLAEEAVPLLRT